MADKAVRKVAFGGNFAPPLSAQRAEEYRGFAKDLPDQIREPFLRLVDMVVLFHKTPPSPLVGSPHLSGRGIVVPLEDKEKSRMWDAIPWPEEMEMYSRLFDTISNEAQKPLRDAAFHLLWFARELDLDREPMTNDRL